MPSTKTLKQRLEFQRYLHLITIAAFALLFYVVSTFPEKWWILLTALVVSSGIQPGLIVRRSMFRIKGTLLALILLLPLLYLFQLNYRFIAVFFVLSCIGLTVSTLNTRRYDITVFFTTLLVFFLTAQENSSLQAKAPVEMLLNRGIATLIGVSIVLLSDYFLFNTFHYSKKLLLFEQLRLDEFFKRCCHDLEKKLPESVPVLQTISKLRAECNALFVSLGTTAENLQLELKSDKPLIERIDQYQTIIWDLRRLLFQMCFSALEVKSPEVFAIQKKELLRLLKLSRRYYIQPG